MPSKDTNRYDLITYLQSNFESGAHWDTYIRTGWDPDKNQVANDTNYNVLQMWSTLLMSEAAYHNGMDRVYEIKAPGDAEPTILRWSRFGYEALNSGIDVRNVAEDLDSEFWLGSGLWFASRRYGDSFISDGLNNRGYNYNHRDVFMYFGYPKDVVYEGSNSNTSSSDFDGDGDVDGYDHYLFFNRLGKGAPSIFDYNKLVNLYGK